MSLLQEQETSLSQEPGAGDSLLLSESVTVQVMGRADAEGSGDRVSRSSLSPDPEVSESSSAS